MARSKSKNQTRKWSGSQPKKKNKPTIFICPYTEQNVYIERATLADLKSKSTYHSGGKKKLWMLTSSSIRHELYAEAAQAMASREQTLLPSFGGRSWEVTCSMREESSSTLFRTWKGKMELAALPHLIDKIPDPPRWPGRRSQQLDEYFENDDDQDIINLQSREVSTLSSVAWDLKHLYPVPVVTTRWQSPDHKIFTSRKTAWGHATELARREILIDKHTLGIGATGKLLQPSIPSAPMALKIGKLRFERDGLWVVQQELTWTFNRQRVLEEENTIRIREGGEYKKTKQNLSAKKNKSNKGSEKSEHQDTALDDKPPDGSHFERAGKAISQSLCRQSRRDEYLEQNHVDAAKLTLKQVETELRELWKSLSKEEQKNWKERLRSLLVKGSEEGATGKSKCEDMMLSENAKQLLDEKVKQAGKFPVNSNIEEATSPILESSAVEIRVPHRSATNNYLGTIPKPKMSILKSIEDTRTNSEAEEVEMSPSSIQVVPQSGGVVSAVVLPANACHDETKIVDASTDLISKEAIAMTSILGPIEASTDKSQVTSKLSMTVPEAKHRPRRQRASRRKQPTTKAMQRWCLNDEQINLCYEACMNHYEDVMRTVKARDLARELADGFDVLRERGRGRFDMELPAFETDAFSFLTDLEKAPWIPIVKSILGDDIALIHKGCFLSLPDAETQVYHQDGVHLNNQTQKPCHAINVFVPLVDLTSRNGPTEFCLGSHMLGNDAFDKDFAETPKPKAGTPVIFDYRLGHRGLGNSSTKCRPIVYCTYARGAGDGKEFRDSVNFSRRRYHKIGKMTKKPLSRDERRMNRKRSIEIREMEVEGKKIAKMEQQVQKSENVMKTVGIHS